MDGIQERIENTEAGVLRAVLQRITELYGDVGYITELLDDAETISGAPRPRQDSNEAPSVVHHSYQTNPLALPGGNSHQAQPTAHPVIADLHQSPFSPVKKVDDSEAKSGKSSSLKHGAGPIHSGVTLSIKRCKNCGQEMGINNIREYCAIHPGHLSADNSVRRQYYAHGFPLSMDPAEEPSFDRYTCCEEKAGSVGCTLSCHEAMKNEGGDEDKKQEISYVEGGENYDIPVASCCH